MMKVDQTWRKAVLCAHLDPLFTHSKSRFQYSSKLSIHFTMLFDPLMSDSHFFVEHRR